MDGKFIPEDTEISIRTENSPEYTRIVSDYLSTILPYKRGEHGLYIQGNNFPAKIVKRIFKSNEMLENLYKFYVSAVISYKLRKKMPNFPLITGISNNTIIQEEVQGRTLDSWLSKNFSMGEFCLILIQLFLVLQKAQEKIGFIHGNLTAENIILKPSPFSVLIFNIGTQTFTIKNPRYIITIINFNSARVRFKHFSFCYKFDPTIFIPGLDVCTLLTSCIEKLDERYRKELRHIIAGNNERHCDLNLRPIDFLNKFHFNKPSLFKIIITIAPRKMRTLSGVNFQNSETVKENFFHLLQNSGKIKPIIIKFNSPIEPFIFYNENFRSKRVDFYNFINTTKENYTIASRYLHFLRLTSSSRQLEELSTEEFHTLLTVKNILHYNLTLLYDYILHKFRNIIIKHKHLKEDDVILEICEKLFPGLTLLYLK